ncbi:MAG: AAA domain-containing protein [Candidatus Moraniibacteriota bacterium]
MNSLKNFSINNWKNLFMAWYYKGALLNYEANTDIGFHKSDSKLQQLAVLYNELSQDQIRQIRSTWGAKRDSKISTFTHNFNTIYNLRKNKSCGRRNSLRKIIETDFELFTSLFPIILTNPGAANAILPLKQGIFNVVIFDEASQLKISDTFTSLIRGQYKIIAGDEHQMPPSNYFQGSSELLDADGNENDENSNEDDEQSVLAEAESLLQFASDLKNVNKSYLDFHYRSNHPALIEFSNSAFYGGNLISFPAQEVYRPIEFRAVNGRYETRTNPAEVAEIIKIIENEIHPNKKGKYPSVGIATFNINQRNLITEALNAVAEKNAEFAIKLQELRERGLFVKNLENIQGDEKDIIIISTTYGIQQDGKFSQNFARLNRVEGYKLLNVLITRAKHKLYVCTSIPKEKYLSYPEIIKNEGNNKKGILYAYLAYAEAISNHESELAEGILRILKEQSFEKPRTVSTSDGLSESPFEEEVYELLLDHFKEEDVIQQHKVGGFRLDFVIKTKTRDVILECDGKSYHQSEEAYAHDMYRQKELERMGFIVYRIWSTNWFRDKEIEMKKLLGFIKTLSL